MLRKKWEFLGADIHDLDTFIEEIASDSFATMEPYLVVHADGTEEPFRAWLEATLAQREVLAAGGAHAHPVTVGAVVVRAWAKRCWTSAQDTRSHNRAT